MTKKHGAARKCWRVTIHDHGGYAIFNAEGEVVGRYTNVEAAIRHHCFALHVLSSLALTPKEHYPIEICVSPELETELCL